MRKLFWLALFVLIVIGSSKLYSSTEAPSLPPAPKSIVSHQPDAAITLAVPTLQIDSKQLLDHVTRLNFQRYTAAERDRARTYLTASLKKLGWTPELQPFAGGINIFAQQQGIDPQAGAVLVAAHYDTVAVSPGADDNATGVAVVLEIARLFNSLPTGRTLKLALFDQEELGLRGSRAFVANTNLANLQGVIVMDMVGFTCQTAGCQKYPDGLPVVSRAKRGDFLAVVGDSEHLPLLKVFQESDKLLPPVLAVPIPFKGILTPDTLRSDHAPFWYQGIGAVLLTDTANLRSPHYHKSSDTPSTLDASFFTGVAQIVVNATAKLVMSREPLETQP